jgi:hypothetical protein
MLRCIRNAAAFRAPKMTARIFSFPVRRPLIDALLPSGLALLQIRKEIEGGKDDTFAARRFCSPFFS